MSPTIPNDADLEALALAQVAAEREAETCQACGEMYASITLLEAGKPGNRVEVYECICGHVSLWYNGRRIS